MFIFFLFFLLFEQIYSQLSVPPTWIGNPYLETNAVQVIGNFEDTSQSGGVNITFEQTYRIPPKVAFAIIRYSGNDGLYDEDFFMRTVRVTQSVAQIFVFMQGVTNIRVLSVMYLAVHPDFQYHLNTFNDIEANYSLTSLSLSPINQRINQIKVFTNYINYTQLCSRITTNFTYFGSDLTKNKVAVYLSGMFNSVVSPDFPEIKFDITAEVVNTSYFKLQVVVNPLYQIDLLKLSFITMDIANIQTSRQYTIVFQTDRYNFDYENYIPLEREFFGDVFIGMLDFNTLSPRSTPDFNLEFDSVNSRIIVRKATPHHLAGYPTSSIKTARLTLFYMKTWFCPLPYYYFNLVTDLCDDYCASYLYGNRTAGQCKPCPTGCLSCDPTNPIVCQTCDSLIDFRQLKNNKCECIEGYIQLTPSDVSCVSCQDYVSNCTKCQLTPSLVCQSCASGWYLNSTTNTCNQCTMTGCLECTSSSVCTVCDMSQNYTLTQNNTCHQCPFTCLCDGYYLPILLNPTSGQRHCSTVCGDGLKREFEECDDGNQEDNDGCSSECKIENYWSCEHLRDDGLTCCVIREEEMYIRVDNVVKSKGQNAFELTLSLYPHLAFLSAQKLKNSLNISLTGIDVVSNQMQVYDTQRIHLKYGYSSHVQKKQCNITISISLQQSNNTDCKMTVLTSMKFYPQSSNNLPLMFFNPESYQEQQKTHNVIDFALYGSYLILALSAIPCKIVGLELFGVLQLAYFSLSQVENLNLMLVPLIKLGAANGYNPSILSESELIPQKISSIQYGNQFLNNCGVMLGVLIAEIVVGLILYAIAAFFQKFSSLLSLTKRLLKQGFLTLLVFNSFNFAFAAGIHFKCASPDQQGYILNSVAAVLTLVLPIFMCSILVFTSSKQFGEFKKKFKRQAICQLYFVFTLMYRYLLGYYIAAKHDQIVGSLVVLAFSLAFLLYNFINLPFTSTLHNYRANICHLSQFGILMIANYYESMKATTDIQVKSTIFSPAFFEVGLIFMTIGASLVGLGYELYLLIKSFAKNKISNSSEQMNKSSLIKENNKSSQEMNNDRGSVRSQNANKLNFTEDNLQLSEVPHIQCNNLSQNLNIFEHEYENSLS